MKIKGHINRLLSHDVDESPPEAARDSQLRLPTLDERVSLYLSAVYGKHDFGNEAYSDARNRILNAMAADIAAKSEINLPEKPKILDFLQDANPNETRWQRDLLDYQHRYAASVRASLPSEPLELSARFSGPTTAALAHALEIEPRRSPSKIEPRKRPALKLAMLAASLCAVAVIGGSVTLGVLREFGVPPKSDLDIAAQSLQKQSETRFRAVTRNGPTNVPDMAPTSAPIAEPPSRNTIAGLDGPRLTNPPTREEVADLVKRGRELIAAGKISDARLLLRSAADAGDATAAFVLATTYDPGELGKLGARDADPDIAMAGAWYQKAKDLGSAGGNR